MKYIVAVALGTWLIASQSVGMHKPVNRDIAILKSIYDATGNEDVRTRSQSLILQWLDLWNKNPRARDLDLRYETRLYAILETAPYQAMLKERLQKCLQSQFDYLKEINLARVLGLTLSDELKSQHLRNAEKLVQFIEQEVFSKIAHFESVFSKEDSEIYKQLRQQRINFVCRAYQTSFLKTLEQGDSQMRELATQKINDQIELLKKTDSPVDFIKRSASAARQITMEV